MKVVYIIIFILTLISPALSSSWHHPLYVGGGGYWNARIPVQILNNTDKDMAGTPISLTIGTGYGELDLVGESAASVRVCDESGSEYLFDIVRGDGSPARDGIIETGDRLVIPAECNANSSKTYYVYFRNSRAWPVPDFFEASPRIRNDSMESGEKSPSGWVLDESNEQHRVSWVTEDPQSGICCLKTEIAEGAEATWIAVRQTNIHISGGIKYVLRGWVRANNAKGTVGWYIHVGNESNPMLLNRVLNAGDGTYNWRQVSIEFTAPEEANVASLGTVLYGTGTGWYDDVVLEIDDDSTANKLPEIRVGEKEEMELSADSGADSWLQTEGKEYGRRIPLRILNFEEEAIEDRLIYTRLDSRLKMGQHDAMPLLVDSGNKAQPYFLLGDGIMFFGNMPARSIAEYSAYFSDNRDAGADKLLTYESLIDHPANLVMDYSFEDGDELTESWKKSPGEKGKRVSPGFLGNYCVRLDVGANDPLGWVGWRQEVPVKPDTSYLYGCHVRTEKIDAPIKLHAHFHDASGDLSKESGFFSTSSSLQGTSDWTLLSSIMRTPADTASVELHLTMNTRGTVWHDGVVLCEVAEASSGYVEYMDSKDPTDYEVWQVNPLVKAFQEDLCFQEANEVEINVARNEKEPVQLAIRSPFPLKHVLVTLQPPQNVQGEKLDVSVHRVGYVPIDHPSSYYSTDLPSWRRTFPTSAGRTDGWAGWWPDPLLPMQKFDLSDGVTQPVWITVSASTETGPGLYSGMILVQCANGIEKRIPLEVKVWDFALPDESHLEVIYDLRNGPGWNVLNPENRRAWYKLMAEHRISPGLLTAPSIRYKDGDVIMDTKGFDEDAAYCLDELKMNVFYTPWQFYCFGWGHPPRGFQGFEPFTPEYKAAYSACLKAFMDHLREKGWDKKVVHYISDEPHYQNEGIIPQMQKLCDMIHEAEPDIEVYSSTWRHIPEWNGYLDIWGVGAYGVFPVEEMEARLKDGDKFWFTTDGQMATDTPYCAIERLYPYYCWKYGASGYEFWGVSWWTHDPFRSGWHSYGRQSSAPGKYESVRYPNGDGFLTYPGWLIGEGGPISSIRLEQVREGIEDYEYLYLLKQNIDIAKERGVDTSAAERALAAAEDLVTIPNAGGLRSTEIMPDPGAVSTIRFHIGEEIAGLMKSLSR
ncbi:glycoside hydrolase domain-containing protein [Candidatus Poribacteria bacterium]